jgi:hypothetical protein
MKTRQLTILTALAAISVVATAAVLRTSAPTIASDRRGEPVLPSLVSRANDITSVTVREGEETLAIERRDNRFVAADSAFPVKTDAVRELLASSGELRFEEARTSDPARYGDLGLADPETKGTGKDGATIAGKDGATIAGKEVVFRAGGNELADFVVGSRDPTVGGPVGGVFVRLKGAPQTFLARGNVQLPSSRSDWFVAVDLDVKRGEIKKIELTGGGREDVTANAEKPGELTLANVPEKRVADTFKVSRLGTLVESFAFQDVRKATKAADDARHMIVDTEDGLRLIYTSIGDLPDGWVQIAAAAQSTDDAKKAKAKLIASKVDGFEFRLPASQAELIGWTVTDLTNEKS